MSTSTFYKVPRGEELANEQVDPHSRERASRITLLVRWSPFQAWPQTRKPIHRQYTSSKLRLSARTKARQRVGHAGSRRVPLSTSPQVRPRAPLQE